MIDEINDAKSSLLLMRTVAVDRATASKLLYAMKQRNAFSLGTLLDPCASSASIVSVEALSSAAIKNDLQGRRAHAVRGDSTHLRNDDLRDREIAYSATCGLCQQTRLAPGLSMAAEFLPNCRFAEVPELLVVFERGRRCGYTRCRCWFAWASRSLVNRPNATASKRPVI